MYICGDNQVTKNSAYGTFINKNKRKKKHLHAKIGKK